MADPVADNADLAVDELKRKARRRLVGAIVLALAAATILPLLLEQEQAPLGDDVAVQIPPVDSGKFDSRLKGDKGADATPEAMPDAGKIKGAPGGGSAAPAPAAAETAAAAPASGTATARSPAAAPAAAKPAATPAAAAPAPAKTAATPAAAAPAPGKTAAIPAAAAPAPGKTAATPAAAAPTPAKAAATPASPAMTPSAVLAPSAPAPTSATASAPTSTSTSTSASTPPASASADAAAGAPATDAATDAAKAEGYVVQLGAFTDKYGANALAGKLKNVGYPAFTEPVETRRGTLWRVRVGGYPTRKAALEARNKLKADGHDGVVTGVK